MNLSNVTLPSYTKTEEILNAVSHAMGVPLGIIGFILCLMKSRQGHAVAGNLIFALSVVVLYSCSTLYHSLKKSDAKKVMRLIDHSSIFILIVGTSIAVSVVCVYPYSKLFTVGIGAAGFIFSAVGTALTFIDQEKYKKVQLVLYVITGWIAVALIFPVLKYCDNAIELLAIAGIGGVVYTLGMAFYIVGKKKRYFHFIFHLFVLCGTVLHLITIYRAI